MRNSIFAAILGMLFTAQVSLGCTIPVFRYALERWDLTKYELVVFHRDEIDKATRRWIEDFERSQLNLCVVWADLREPLPKSLEELQRRLPKLEVPVWAALQMPQAATPSLVLWHGPLDRAVLTALADSPARQQILKELAQGASAVFVRLTSTDSQRDSAAQQLLEKRLPILEKQIKLPVQSETGPKIELKLPLAVRLPAITLQRDDPREAEWIRFLLKSDESLQDADGPICFIVFGRGRLLGSLHGDDLSAEQLYRAVSFLCGECSCQVKELNPGIDLLVRFDWDAKLRELRLPGETATPPAPSEAVEDTMPPQPEQAFESQNLEASPEVKMVETEERPPWLWPATLAAGVLVLVTGWWVASRKS